MPWFERPFLWMLRREYAGAMRFDEDDSADVMPPAPAKPCQLYVHVPFCEVLCPFCSFHRVRYNATRTSRYFEALRGTFGGACEVLTVLDAQGRPVSGVLSFYFRDEVLPYYAGDLESARELAANDFKYWDLMRRACERGVRVFDYGRSKRDTGSFHFKKNWGFEPTPLAYEYKLFKREAIPQNNPANPKYRAMIAVWRRLPRSVANALGPSIVRNLG